MAKTGTALALVVGVVVCASSNAEARRWRFYSYYNPDQNAQSEQNRSGELRPAPQNQAVGFSATVEQLIRGCTQEGIELKNWPLDLVAQTVVPDEGQRNALEQMRSAATKAGDALASTCPSDVPVPLPARFDALGHSLDSYVEALDVVRPAVELFYNSLNDEQKARLVAMYMSNASSQDKSDQSRRSSRGVRASRELVTQQNPICQRWADALRDWPIRQIESGLALADDQRAALYELTASIYRGAGALTASCSAETSFTPLGQIDAKRKRIEALRQAINLVRPSLGRFADVLNDQQKTRLANVVASTQTKSGRRRGRNDDDD